MNWIIDRIEGDFAVIECGNKCFNVPKSALPDGIKEGDVLKIDILKSKTDELKAQADALLKELFENKD